MSIREVEVHIDANAVQRKCESLLDDDTMMKLQETFADVINPWTPFLTGQLSGDITSR